MALGIGVVDYESLPFQRYAGVDSDLVRPYQLASYSLDSAHQDDQLVSPSVSAEEQAHSPPGEVAHLALQANTTTWWVDWLLLLGLAMILIGGSVLIWGWLRERRQEE
jgi:hypothetical protein